MSVIIVPKNPEKAKPLSILGVFKDAKGKEIASYLRKPFYVPSVGLILDEKDPDNKKVIDLIKNSVQLRPYFYPMLDDQGNEVNTSTQIFKIEDTEGDAIASLENIEAQVDYMNKIKNLKDVEVKAFGLLFGYLGTVAIVKNNLLKALQSNDAIRKTIIERYDDVDRTYKEVMQFMLNRSKTSQDKNNVISRSGTGVYSVNGVSVGISEDKVILHLKDEPTIYRDFMTIMQRELK